MIRNILEVYLFIGAIIGALYVFYYFKYKYVKPSEKQDYKGREVSITYGKTAIGVSIIFTYFIGSLLWPLILFEVINDIKNKGAKL